MAQQRCPYLNMLDVSQSDRPRNSIYLSIIFVTTNKSWPHVTWIEGIYHFSFLEKRSSNSRIFKGLV